MWSCAEATLRQHVGLHPSRVPRSTLTAAAPSPQVADRRGRLRRGGVRRATGRRAPTCARPRHRRAPAARHGEPISPSSALGVRARTTDTSARSHHTLTSWPTRPGAAKASRVLQAWSSRSPRPLTPRMRSATRATAQAMASSVSVWSLSGRWHSTAMPRARRRRVRRPRSSRGHRRGCRARAQPAGVVVARNRRRSEGGATPGAPPPRRRWVASDDDDGDRCAPSTSPRPSGSNSIPPLALPGSGSRVGGGCRPLSPAVPRAPRRSEAHGSGEVAAARGGSPSVGGLPHVAAGSRSVSGIARAADAGASTGGSPGGSLEVAPAWTASGVAPRAAHTRSRRRRRSRAPSRRAARADRLADDQEAHSTDMAGWPTCITDIVDSGRGSGSTRSDRGRAARSDAVRRGCTPTPWHRRRARRHGRARTASPRSPPRGSWPP